jgi:hypothetical protein
MLDYLTGLFCPPLASPSTFDTILENSPSLHNVFDVLPFLPESISSFVLSFLGARFIDGTVALVSRAYFSHARSPELWFMLCCDAGKTYEVIQQRPLSPRHYRDFYLSHPHVPLDCASVSGALEKVAVYGSVVVQNGAALHEDTLTVTKCCCIKVVSPSNPDSDLRASISTKTPGYNMPLLQLSEEVTVSITDVSFLHDSSGYDIWNGNTTIRVLNATVYLTRCTVTSATGRGIVVSAGGNVYADYSVVRDCAATGVYVEGWCSEFIMNNCSIANNGFGGKTPRSVGGNHSGVYISSSYCVMNDCTVEDNSVTGINVSDGGAVEIRGCVCEDFRISSDSVVKRKGECESESKEGGIA